MQSRLKVFCIYVIIAQAADIFQNIQMIFWIGLWKMSELCGVGMIRKQIGMNCRTFAVRGRMRM